MPKGSVRNPGTKKTAKERQYTSAYNASNLSDNSGASKKRMTEAYAFLEKSRATRDARKANLKTMKKPGAGRVALMPIKKTIRPATSAKKGK